MVAIIVQILLCVIILALILYSNRAMLKRFKDGNPTEEDLKKFKVWLFNAVVAAQKCFGGGTGELKLANVYAKALEKWPGITDYLTYEDVVDMVSEQKDKLKKLCGDNLNINTEIYGENTDTDLSE